MASPTFGAHAHAAQLAIVSRRAEPFAPTDDFYEENPLGAFRGIGFALVFNVLLTLSGFAVWGLWRLVR